MLGRLTLGGLHGPSREFLIRFLSLFRSLFLSLSLAFENTQSRLQLVLIELYFWFVIWIFFTQIL